MFGMRKPNSWFNPLSSSPQRCGQKDAEDVELNDFHMAKLSQYRCQLYNGVKEYKSLIELRKHFPERFHEICKVHLSFLIDIPCDFLDTLPNESNRTRPNNQDQSLSWTKRFFFSNSKAQATSKYQSIPEGVVHNLEQLLEFLSLDSCLCVEGLFRKSGNLTRQRELRDLVMSTTILPDNFLLSQSRYNVHDVAGALKSVLSDLHEPLLTTRFLPLFSQIANLQSLRVNDSGQEVLRNSVDQMIMEGKQLKSLRILILLLPANNRQILLRLLELLNLASQKEENRMSPESLGTLFGPLLLTPKKISCKELRSLYPVLNQLATDMIKWNSQLSSIPKTLADDLFRNLCGVSVNCQLSDNCLKYQPTNHPVDTPLSMKSLPNSQILREETNGAFCHTAESDSSLILTSIAFTERRCSDDSSGQSATPQIVSSTPIATTNPETEYAVAELYAHLQRLPDSTCKKKMVHKFNQLNGGLTPELSSEFLRSTSQGRGIRSSLRKRLAFKQSSSTSKQGIAERSFTSLRDALSSHTPLSCIRDSSPGESQSPPRTIDQVFKIRKRQSQRYCKNISSIPPPPLPQGTPTLPAKIKVVTNCREEGVKYCRGGNVWSSSTTCKLSRLASPMKSRPNMPMSSNNSRSLIKLVDKSIESPRLKRSLTPIPSSMDLGDNQRLI